MYAELEIAEEILLDAYKQNPGGWMAHSKMSALVARIIAKNTHGILNEHKAYSLGLLHDIGRIKGITSMKHIIDGYEYMKDLGYDENARICLTHSFPIKNIQAYTGKNDLDNNAFLFINDFIQNTEYDDYDKLIQLCDALCTSEGIVIIEKRLIDVAIRNGINELSVEKWKAFISLIGYFNSKYCIDVYSLLGLQDTVQIPNMNI